MEEKHSKYICLKYLYC